MKKIILACGAALALTAVTSCGSGSSAAADSFGDSIAQALGTVTGAQFDDHYKTLSDAEKEKLSKDDFLKGFKEALMADTTSEGYSQGMAMGMNMLQQVIQIERNSDIRINRQKIYEALSAALKGDSVDMNALQAQMMSLGQKLNQRMEDYHQQQVMAQPDVQESIKAGKAAIDKAKAEGYKTTSSGLVYKEITPGTGDKKPVMADRVKVRYVGKHVDGSEFDSSKGEEATFALGQVIPGFSEGLMMMTPGSKYIFYIPGELAYGANGQPQAGINPMETLVFEVELVSIEEAPAAPAAQPMPGTR